MNTNSSHHDNANSDKWTQLTDTKNINSMGQVSLNTDLAKNILRAQRFLTPVQATGVLKKHVLDMPISEYKKRYKNLKNNVDR